jgi:hypothetical protein
VRFPSDYVGDYFYADYCGKTIWRVDSSTKSRSTFATGTSSVVDIKVGTDGNLYYLQHGGTVRKVTFSGTVSQPPTITDQPDSKTVSVGQSVTFTVGASGSGTLTYQWQRNGANISGATSPSFTLASPQLSDSGAGFRCMVKNSVGTATSNTATLTVTSNKAPTATISTPAAGTLYSGGQTISYSGKGTDPEDGTLAASQLTWQVDFHHDTHIHPVHRSDHGRRQRLVRGAGRQRGLAQRLVSDSAHGEGQERPHQPDLRRREAAHRHLHRGQQPDRAAADPGRPALHRAQDRHRRGGHQPPDRRRSPRRRSAARPSRSRPWSDGKAATHTISTPSTATTFTANFSKSTVRIFEAESALLSGAVVASTKTGFTGTGYADYINASGDFVEWTVSAATAGTKTLTFRFANGSTATRSLAIKVNGTTVNSNLGFAPTGDWAIWKTVSVSAALIAGTNKIRATATGTSGPNIDHLEAP